MGDTRYREARERYDAARRKGNLASLSPETGLQALGALAAETDALGANVLTTRLLNQFRRSATLLRYVAEGVVALDAGGRILYANPAAERVLGWEEGQLIGRDLHATVHHHRGDGEPVRREECLLLSALDATRGEVLDIYDHDGFTRKDGSTFFAGITAAPILHRGEPMGLAVLFRDITAEKERETRLVLHSEALDAVPEPVFWLDQDGGILYVNLAASEHLGYSRDELVRMRVFDFDPVFTPEGWKENWERIKQGEIVRVDSRHKTRSGEVVPVAITIRHVEHEGDEFHVALARRKV